MPRQATPASAPRQIDSAPAHEEETWKPALRHQGYEVSSLGRVRSFWARVGRFYEIGPEPRYLIPNGRRYLHVTLRTAQGKRQQVDVQRLVLEAFVGPQPPGHEACHRDGDSSNNRLSNLRWGTRLSNIREKWTHGTMPVGERTPCAKLDRGKVRDIRERCRNGEPKAAVAASYGVHYSTVNRIIKGLYWKDSAN